MWRIEWRIRGWIKKCFRQLTEVLPNLYPWTKAAAKFDGSAPDALKFEAPGMMDLNVDILHRNGSTCEIAMSHYYKHPSGDMIADPDMQVCIDFGEKSAIAHTYQDAFRLSRDRKPTWTEFQNSGQTKAIQLTAFLSQWLENIKAQGFEPKPHD